MQGLFYLFAVLLVLVVLGLAIWGVVRYRYVRSLKRQGWEFDSNPTISIAHGLNIPPFGIGFDRSVDDAIYGTSSDGTPFIAFKYRCSEWHGRGYVVRMPLPSSYLPGEVTGPGCEQRMSLSSVIQFGSVLASASGGQEIAGEYAQALEPCLRAPFRISIDHESLILIDAPKNAQELSAAIELLAGARRALLALPAQRLLGPPAPPGLSVYGHDNWVYLVQDDAYLTQIEHTTGGSNHQAKDVIYGTDSNIAFLRLTHTWDTTHTSSNGNGGTTVHTEHHEEQLCEFRLLFPFREISFNWGWLGSSQKFEWADFNKNFKVRCADPRFASDVIHQRQMEYLMATRPGAFAISSDGFVRFKDDYDWETATIESLMGFLLGFLGRVPDFVWQNLGAWPRPVAATPGQ